jgi:hypothetical protein
MEKNKQTAEGTLSVILGIILIVLQLIGNHDNYILGIIAFMLFFAVIILGSIGWKKKDKAGLVGLIIALVIVIYSMVLTVSVFLSGT